MTDWNNNSQTCERIIVHENTHEPSEAWKKIKNSLVKKHVEPLAFDTPMSDDKVRFVCISDTHGKTDKLKIPKADVLLHAGDFTMYGWPDEIAKFNRFLATLDIKHKVVIAGNHEHTFESDGKTRDMLDNCVYLQESSIELFGIKIYGAPWIPKCRGSFNVTRGVQLLNCWNKIPDDTDILVTHGPPLGYGDKTCTYKHVGCCELLSTIQKRIKPLYHVYGHIHEGYGVRTDDTTIFINSSICNRLYRPVNAPIIFDMPLPDNLKA